MRTLAGALSVAACAACDEPLFQAAVFCAPCAATVLHGTCERLSSPAITIRLAAPVAYGGAVATAINRFKHRDRPDLAHPLGEICRARLRAEPHPEVDVIIPVPLHRVRLAERGYNPAALLARRIAHEISAPVRFDVLDRRVHTRSQQGLSARARLVNVASAFEVAGDVAGRRALLVDDVCTTGATLLTCAQRLLAAGAARVDALVLARRS